jgi:ribosomal protein S27AE
MTMAAGARMWESEMFTEDQMVAWENKTAAQQTWQALQDYFTEKWLERRQYSQATAKHSRFKDAALAAQETAAAEEEGEASAMMFALLQEQHRAQLDAMATANQKAMDVMFERMNAMVAGKGTGPDKENAPPGGNANPAADNDTGTTKQKKKKCPHCGKTVFHKAAECYELEANASKRWAGWKSVKDTGEATK